MVARKHECNQHFQLLQTISRTLCYADFLNESVHCQILTRRTTVLRIRQVGVGCDQNLHDISRLAEFADVLESLPLHPLDTVQSVIMWAAMVASEAESVHGVE